MPSLPEIAAEARFALALPRFFRNRLSIDEARAAVRDRLRCREEMFREMIRGAVFSQPDSPYRWLFERAGIGEPDVSRLLASEGLERTLSMLRAAGVFVSFEEFKGRQPIVRNGRELPADAHAFDNPLARHHLSGASSGSTGAATSLAIDLRNIIDRAPAMMLALDAHGVLTTPMALWRSILPSIAAITSILRGVVMGNIPERWFSPLAPGELKAPLKNRLATRYIVQVGRAAGAALPHPEYVPFDRAVIVAQWAREAVKRRGRSLVRGHVSALSRVAVAAIEAGVDLNGVVLWGGGEPPTESKLAPILRSGAVYRSTYFLSEAGAIGLPCANPSDPTEVHAMEDAIVIAADEPWSDQPRQMLWLTGLIPSAPKVMLNVESDDVATAEWRDCGCPLQAAGFQMHLSRIRSARKLTSEGMRVLGIDVLALVEEFLPSRYGAAPQHFQIAEEEDGHGRTRVVLIVDPSVSLPEERVVREDVLAFVGTRGAPAQLAASTWRQAGSLIVRREAPRWTAHGKLPPLRVSDGVAQETR